MTSIFRIPPMYMSNDEINQIVERILGKTPSSSCAALLYKILTNIEDGWPPKTQQPGVDFFDVDRRTFLLDQWERFVTAHGASPLNALGASILCLADFVFLFVMDPVCSISGNEFADAVNIFPYYRTDSTAKDLKCIIEFSRLWYKDIQYFRPGFNDDDLNSLLDNDSIMRSPQNRLFLDQRLHRLWSSGRFALRPMLVSDPIVDTERRDLGLWTRWDSVQQNYFVKVEFQWLSQGQFKPTHMIGEDFDINRFRSCRLWGTAAASTKAFRASGIPIMTGHVFNLRSIDRHSLPSFELLQLRYAFSLITAMGGFNHMTEDDWASDSEGTNTPPGASDDEDGNEAQPTMGIHPDNGNGEASRPRKRVRFE